MGAGAGRWWRRTGRSATPAPADAAHRSPPEDAPVDPRHGRDTARDYWLARERAERAAAERATDTIASRLHLDLARRYAAKADDAGNG